MDSESAARARRLLGASAAAGRARIAETDEKLAENGATLKLRLQNPKFEFIKADVLSEVLCCVAAIARAKSSRGSMR
jgi:hypothetical protein